MWRSPHQLKLNYLSQQRLILVGDLSIRGCWPEQQGPLHVCLAECDACDDLWHGRWQQSKLGNNSPVPPRPPPSLWAQGAGDSGWGWGRGGGRGLERRLGPQTLISSQSSADPPLPCHPSSGLLETGLPTAGWPICLGCTQGGFWDTVVANYKFNLHFN